MKLEDLIDKINFKQNLRTALKNVYSINRIEGIKTDEFMHTLINNCTVFKQVMTSYLVICATINDKEITDSYKKILRNYFKDKKINKINEVEGISNYFNKQFDSLPLESIIELMTNYYEKYK